jgi:hypothetical protein
MAFFVRGDEPPSSIGDPGPIFSPDVLDMTEVGWSLNLPCQVTAPEKPDSRCRLSAGHGGSHEELVGGEVVQWAWGIHPE